MSEEMWTEEAEYNVIFEYLSGNRQTYHGLSKNKKRMLRKKTTNFSITDGFLVYKNTRRWIINKKDRRKILESCHSDNLAVNEQSFYTKRSV